ncbi:hypoxia up-regulated protein 1 [Agrilus planipennis]|uniref:Hypoxia up-regulated protein 1 n=1 Tax=Agrilus planipennis TaxID=224129 RepID=A0A1W4WWZ7_AGRPL|nr:hypoxia up-regulated protein 1 [Agrilus planipennis]
MRWELLAVSFILITSVVDYVCPLAVMSVDLGSEWMKIGIVSPGVPMEIVLNKESKRKTPTVVSFRDNVRTFGEDAQTVGTRFPSNSYAYLLELLGKDINHPLVKLYQKRFPYYNIVEDPQRGTVLFKHDENTFYSPEELVAQLLYRAKEFADISAQQTVKECVLTVPGYFNQAERKALLQAAELANIKVLQLINDHTATALNYGIFRIKDFNETAQYVMFYDMGATSTTATIVSYQTIKIKEKGFVEMHPQLTVIGYGYDRTLGGLEMTLRLRDYLATKFNEMKKTPTDIFTSPRALAKLFKEAGRVKQVLSANADHYAQVEGLLDEVDFRLQVTREEFENLCADLFERVSGPVERALKMAGLSKEILNQVVLTGAGTRVPKVQEKLQKVVGQELAKNLNTDESAAMGAVYKAADLSTGFQVKKFLTRDGVIFPIQVVFERETEAGLKQVKRTLFGLMNPYPQKKIITFNKHVDDFTFYIYYAELDHLPENELLCLGNTNLTEITLKGVAEALKKHKGPNVDGKGIKAHFSLDESGILKLVNVEFVFEKVITKEVEEEQGTLSKLGSTLSRLFSNDEEASEKVEEKQESFEESAQEVQSDKDEKLNKTAANETTSKNTTEKHSPNDIKPKIVTIKEPIKALENILHIKEITKDQLNQAVEKLEKLNAVDKELNRRATALNNLESFVIDTQNKLYEDAYTQAATPEEIEKIRKACSETSDWLYEDGAEADAATYEKRLKELNSLTKDLYARVYEHRERPEALNALNSMLNGSIKFLESAKNLTKEINPEKDVFTDIELKTLEKTINDTRDWANKKVEEQDNIKKSDPVVLTVRMISEKMSALDREVKYLVNKLKIWRPKKTEKSNADKNNTKSESGGANKTEKTEESLKEENIPNPTTDEAEKKTSKQDKEKLSENESIKSSEQDNKENHSEL